MIRAILYDDRTGRCTLGGQDLLDVWRGSDHTILWLDLLEVPNDVEAGIMREYFGLHPLAIQDAQRERHPPKVESFSDHTFVLLKGLDAQSQDLQFGTIQIAIFVGARFLVTRHTGVSPSIDQLWAQTEAAPPMIAAGADSLAIMLARLVVNRYLPILLAIETRLDDLEDEMVKRPTERLLAELVGHRAQLKKLRRVITYHVKLFETITASMPPGIRGELSHELTIVTTIFVPLSFLAGVYGMNFEYIPELRFRYGYFVILGLMAATAGGALFAMHRQGWMGERSAR